MTEDQIRQAILASPFAQHVEALMAGGQPGLRLHAEKVALDDLAPGASRLGGLPDLPPGRSWPYDGNDRPLEMVAQIDLAEVAGFSYLPDLPASGWLVLQISSDERDPGWMWGDNGRLYYWIRRQDLAAREFSKIRCIMQSH